MSLNVNRNVQDTFYRYKMPRLQAKVEGKGNGIKTVIPNMVEIARALGRPPTYTIKYFGCELGAQTQVDFKNDRYIVNGFHDASKLQDMLDGFIKKFVLCEQCENPETDLKVKKGVIGASCKACGHVYTMDMRHKLTTFIVKNPPDQSLSAHGTSLTEKKDRKSKRRNEDGDKEESNGSPEHESSHGDSDWDEDEWGDTSEEAIRARMKELTLGVKGLAMDNDMEKSEFERINIFHDFVAEKIQSQKNFSSKEIHAEAERLEISNKAVIVLCELLLCSSSDLFCQIKKHRELFLRFVQGNGKAAKYLIGGIEKIIEVQKETLLPKTPHILKACYDADILDEETICDWHKKISKKYVSKELSEAIHKKAEPFVLWLKEAEEESENSDSDVELQFDERAKISSLKQIDENNGKTAAAPTTNGNEKKSKVSDDDNNNDDDDEKEEEDDDDDEIDIDDI